MIRLHPEPTADVDPLDTYAVERPAPPGRPWVLLDMVASIDGATAVAGRSGALGGPGDHAVFHALRAMADVILVGAATVRAERYGPPRISPEDQHRRVARGQAPVPTIAVVSRSLAFDLTSSLFDGDVVVLAPTGAPPGRQDAVRDRAELVLAGTGDAVDLGEALAALAHRDAELVVCEGGPVLNAQLATDDLVDEVCLTIAPLLAGGDSARLLAGAALDDRRFTLAHVLTDHDELFLRYVRR